MYDSDTEEGLSCNCSKFADDTKLFNAADNAGSLQNDLIKLSEWSNTWQMQFNIDKRKIMLFGKRNPKQ